MNERTPVVPKRSKNRRKAADYSIVALNEHAWVDLLKVLTFGFPYTWPLAIYQQKNPLRTCEGAAERQLQLIVSSCMMLTSLLQQLRRSHPLIQIKCKSIKHSYLVSACSPRGTCWGIRNFRSCKNDRREMELLFKGARGRFERLVKDVILSGWETKQWVKGSKKLRTKWMWG
jgi:hypothetical protein